MSNAIFPSLRGVAAERDSTPVFDNIIQRAAGGRRYALGKRFYPVWRIRLKFNFLRQKLTHTELADLEGFFLQRHGNLDSFLYRDREWNTVATPQVFGIGDGVTKDFRLVYPRGGFIDRCGYVTPTGLVVTAGGTPTVAFTLDNNANLSFTTAPAMAASLAWTGAYFYRVAFSKPDLTFTQFLKDLYSVSGVELESTNV